MKYGWMNAGRPRATGWLVALAGMIVLVGCSPLKPARVDYPNTFLLEASPTNIPARNGGRVETRPLATGLNILVAMPKAHSGYDTSRMAYLRQPHELEYFAKNQWVDAPARMLWPILAQAVERTGRFSAVVQSPGTVNIDQRLDTELIRLHQDFTRQPSVLRMSLRAQLIDTASRRVLATREFDISETADADDPYGGVQAANRAVARLARDIADFVASSPGAINPTR